MQKIRYPVKWTKKAESSIIKITDYISEQKVVIYNVIHSMRLR